jgi:hypothetical protein
MALLLFYAARPIAAMLRTVLLPFVQLTGEWELFGNRVGPFGRRLPVDMRASVSDRSRVLPA